MKRLPPEPPYSSGTSIPMSPSSKYFGIRAGSILPACSIVLTRGRTSSSANPATASRNMTSSSERIVSADAVVSVCMGGHVCPLEHYLGELFVEPERRQIGRASCREREKSGESDV